MRHAMPCRAVPYHAMSDALHIHIITYPAIMNETPEHMHYNNNPYILYIAYRIYRTFCHLLLLVFVTIRPGPGSGPSRRLYLYLVSMLTVLLGGIFSSRTRLYRVLYTCIICRVAS